MLDINFELPLKQKSYKSIQRLYEGDIEEGTVLEDQETDKIENETSEENNFGITVTMTNNVIITKGTFICGGGKSETFSPQGTNINNIQVPENSKENLYFNIRGVSVSQDHNITKYVKLYTNSITLKKDGKYNFTVKPYMYCQYQYYINDDTFFGSLKDPKIKGYIFYVHDGHNLLQQGYPEDNNYNIFDTNKDQNKLTSFNNIFTSFSEKELIFTEGKKILNLIVRVRQLNRDNKSGNFTVDDQKEFTKFKDALKNSILQNQQDVKAQLGIEKQTQEKNSMMLKAIAGMKTSVHNDFTGY